MWLDRWGATDTEVASAMPGDHLVAAPGSVATRSITLGCGPDEVFDWLAQMGTGRAGWYSYDLIDNFGRRSARHIEPSWQVGEAGEPIPAGPMAFDTPVVDRPHALVIAVRQRRLLGHVVDFVLAYRLDPAAEASPSSAASEDAASTRLVTRATIAIRGPLGRLATVALTVGDGVMVRRQLIGLRERCG
ncbi:MAG: hypothetical protein AAF467_10250 [Actinomycetota bacterium]